MKIGQRYQFPKTKALCEVIGIEGMMITFRNYGEGVEEHTSKFTTDEVKYYIVNGLLIPIEKDDPK